ncbi:MAG: AraC family transcriptional regulator [Dysgonamonadaceae bacterium]|jgi:AraC-like DNA-binding protein|nr:AraC family transcriptional regulator [Dysgonamonadaceae bacterium]
MQNNSATTSPLELNHTWNSASFADAAAFNSPVTFRESIILFVTKGGIRIDGNNFGQYSLSENQMVLIPRDFECKIDAKCPLNILTCIFSMEHLFAEQNLIDDFFSEEGTTSERLSTLPVKRLLRQFLSFLDNCMKAGLNSDNFLDMKRTEFNQIMVTQYSKQEIVNFFKEVVSKNIRFKKLVWDNYQSARNVKELAALANYSTSGFIKKFKKNFNESPYHWMQIRKSQQILHEIGQGIKPLQEIANNFKFSSYQHFANFCKTHFGFPPTEIYGKKLSVNGNKMLLNG